MRVEKIWISRNLNGTLSGKVEIKGKIGSIEVRVGDAKSREIVNILADQLLDIAKEAADIMRDDVIEHNAEIKLVGEKP